MEYKKAEAIPKQLETSEDKYELTDKFRGEIYLGVLKLKNKYLEMPSIYGSEFETICKMFKDIEDLILEGRKLEGLHLVKEEQKK